MGQIDAGLALEFRDGQGRAIESTVDGNALQVAARLAEPAAEAATVNFTLAGRTAPFATCTIQAGDDACWATVRADGWAWENHVLVSAREILAAKDGAEPANARGSIAVSPKPVVLVHGFNSDHRSWIEWTRSGGYLEGRGMVGYAVDDGQFGTSQMDTGSTARPADLTNSIAENAGIVAEYVEAVRANTGAERVDLVAHSMGGLIARYYVQNLMPEVSAPGLPAVPAANQLYMAGTPNGGTTCARIPAAVGILLPATHQITPDYVTQVFNPTVHDRRGVPFFALAGDAVRTRLAIHCTDLPTDMVVSVNSVLHGVPVMPQTMAAIHTDLNNGADAFEVIFASLSRSPEDYPIEMSGATEPILTPPDLVQSTVVKGGTLQTGVPTTVTLTIDQASNASFILYAPGSTVSMTVRTVSGALLTEATPLTNPNVTFERVLDPSMPVSLGYGVLNPRAGAWDIGLLAHETPPGGGPFALTAVLETDLQLSASAGPAVVRPGETVTVRAQFQGSTLPQQMQVRGEIRNEQNEVEVAVLALGDNGTNDDGAAGDGNFAAQWRPVAAGEYRIILAATGTDGAGNPFERLAVLGVSVEQPGTGY